MKSQREKHRLTNFNRVMKYLGMAMAVIYIGTGTAILWDASGLFNIPAKYALPLGSMMVVYGLFRCYRNIQKHYQK